MTVTLTVSGGDATVPQLTGKTLAEAEELLKKSSLKLNPTLNYVDTRVVKESGIISSQSPEAGSHVMLETAVTLNIYHHATSLSVVETTVTVPESSEEVTIRLTLQAEGSETELEAFQYVCPPDSPRQQNVRINLPDERNYTCRIYQNEQLTEQFETGKQ